MRNFSKIYFPLTVTVVLNLATLPEAQAALLVSSGDTGEILSFKEDTGKFTGVFVSSGSGGLERPIGLTYGPDNNLYVSSFDVSNPSKDAILRYDGKTGAFIDTFISGTSSKLSRPSNLIFGPDNDLYVSSIASGGVSRYDGETGAFINTLVPNSISAPSLTFGPDNDLYVSSVNKGVLRYDGETGASIGTFVSPKDTAPKIPGGLDFGPDDNLYVGDFTPEGGVLRYDGKTGAFIDTFISSESGDGELNLPSLGLTFGPDSNFYITSLGNSSVRRYDGKTGEFIDALVPSGSGGLSSPESLTFSPRPIPEPSSHLGLLGLGSLLGIRLVLQNWQKRRKSHGY